MQNLKINSLFGIILLFLLSSTFTSCEKIAQEKLEKEKLPSLLVDLQGHWELEGDATDIGPNAYHGMIQGASPTIDRFGDDEGALDFNGTSDYINLGNIKELGLGGFQPYAISAWVKTGATGGTIFSKWNGGVLAGWYLRVTGDMNVASYRNVGPWAAYSNDKVIVDEWQNYVTQYDGENLTIYIDGELQSREKFTSQPHDNKTDILIGALHSKNEVDNYFNGTIDDLRIWSRTLTDEELNFLSTH